MTTADCLLKIMLAELHDREREAVVESVKREVLGVDRDARRCGGDGEQLKATGLVGTDWRDLDDFIGRVKSASNELIYGSKVDVWEQLNMALRQFDKNPHRPRNNPLQTAIDGYLEDVSGALFNSPGDEGWNLSQWEERILSDDCRLGDQLEIGVPSNRPNVRSHLR